VGAASDKLIAITTEANEETVRFHAREHSHSTFDYLNHLPPITLRIDDNTAAALHHLGISNIGLLRRLPREQLPARFGPLLLKRLNQALGLEPELLVPIRPIEPIESGIEFDFGVDSIELLWDVIQEHLDCIIRQLIRRCHGVRRMQFDLLLQNAEPVSQTIELSRPSREPKRLFRLVRLTLEQIAQAHADNGPRRSARQRPKTKARDLFGARFTGIHFRVLESLRVREDQIAFLESEQVADEQAVADLIERLQLRLEQGVMQAALVESHVPEKRWEPAAPAVATAAPPRRRRPAAPGINAGMDHAPRVAFDSVTVQRPLTLTPTPREIRVMVSPSHDRDGRPVAVTLDGQHHRVACARGPERIAGQWWTGHHKTRDYFDIELDDAKRLWVFRVAENGRWFVHGDF
jgi:protein ImuB